MTLITNDIIKLNTMYGTVRMCTYTHQTLHTLAGWLFVYCASTHSACSTHKQLLFSFVFLVFVRVSLTLAISECSHTIDEFNFIIRCKPVISYEHTVYVNILMDLFICIFGLLYFWLYDVWKIRVRIEC